MNSKTNELLKNFFKESIRAIPKYSRMVLAVILCAVSVFSAEILKSSVKTYNVFDGVSVKSVQTYSRSLTAALNCVNLESDNYRILSAEKSGSVTDIRLQYIFPVRIFTGDDAVTVNTSTATVGEILKRAGFNPDKDDIVEPSEDTVISSKADIVFSSVSYVSGSYTEKIPYKKETVAVSDKFNGTRYLNAGTDGSQEVYFTNKVINGETVETKIDKTVVLKKPVNRKQIKGVAKSDSNTSKPKRQAVKTSENVKSVSRLSPDMAIKLDKNGVPVNYKKKITTQATGYTYTGKRCATGVAPKPGYIAVNPRVIPYGTKMYIKSSDGAYVYGYAVAADTGGFVRRHPNNVDLFFDTRSACVSFGRRNVGIYIIG